VVIAVVSVFYLKFVRVDEPAPVRDREPVVAQLDSDQPAEDPSGLPDSGESPTAGDLTTNQPAADTESDSPGLDEDPQNTGSDLSSNDTADGQAALPVEEAGDPLAETGEDNSETPLVEEVQTPDEISQETPAEPVFTMDPYLQDVGVDGWALHLYSFPDSLAAESQANALRGRGFRTETRPVQFKDKGRWFRVYVGSFVTRGEALEARDPLFEKLNIDWARATEF